MPKKTDLCYLVTYEPDNAPAEKHVYEDMIEAFALADAYLDKETILKTWPVTPQRLLRLSESKNTEGLRSWMVRPVTVQELKYG